MPRGTVAWIWDTRATWQSLVLAGKKPVIVSGATVLLPAAQGAFQVQCSDTRTGQELSRQSIKAGANGLAVPLPDFATDVAIKAVSVP